MAATGGARWRSAVARGDLDHGLGQRVAAGAGGLGIGPVGVRLLFHASLRFTEDRSRRGSASDVVRAGCGVHGDDERCTTQGGEFPEKCPGGTRGPGSRPDGGPPADQRTFARGRRRGRRGAAAVPGPGELGRGDCLGSRRYDLSVLVREQPGRTHPRRAGRPLAVRTDILEGSSSPGRSRMGGVIPRQGNRRETRPRFRVPHDRRGRQCRVAARPGDRGRRRRTRNAAAWGHGGHHGPQTRRSRPAGAGGTARSHARHHLRA